MAGQLGSENLEQFPGEEQLSLGDLDQNTREKVTSVAQSRGVTPKIVISEIVTEHMSFFTQERSEEKNSGWRSPKTAVTYPRRFVDPADQISVDEEFKDQI